MPKCMSDKKTAIVTGASQGIGAGLVKAFLKASYNVVATSDLFYPYGKRTFKLSVNRIRSVLALAMPRRESSSRQ
jgi:ABC-type uncharacterized transport system substrate-binding protein